jgi:hypothetical protein
MDKLSIATRQGNESAIRAILISGDYTEKDRQAAVALSVELNKFNLFNLLYKDKIDANKIVSYWFNTCDK